MSKYRCFITAALVLALTVALSACNNGSPASNTSSAEVSQESSELVSFESSSEVSSSEATSTSSADIFIEESSSQAASSKPAASSSKAVTPKPAASSKPVSSSKATVSVDNDYGTLDDEDEDEEDIEPYVAGVYRIEADEICKIRLRNVGECEITGADVIDINDAGDDAEADIDVDDTSISVNPSTYGRYSIIIYVDDPSEGVSYELRTLVIVEKDDD